ncbi:MAG: C_GCAxxG_C_C family protein [Clostridia bacterium]|nr:C_GCAxxG_C_C family protein [Clostridia bacterium]
MTEKERAKELFLEGYNCSQSVFTAFSHRFGIDEETAKKISAGLGGGIGRQREVCGAVSAAAMVIGDICAGVDGEDVESKTRNYELVQKFSEKFTEKHGSIICRELLENHEKNKGAAPDDRTEEYYQTRPCLRLVEDAAEILMQMLEEK